MFLDSSYFNSDIILCVACEHKAKCADSEDLSESTKNISSPSWKQPSDNGRNIAALTTKIHIAAVSAPLPASDHPQVCGNNTPPSRYSALRAVMLVCVRASAEQRRT